MVMEIVHDKFFLNCKHDRRTKNIIIFDNNGTYNIMFNPMIIKCSEPYETEEGRLSLEGTHPVKRYHKIKVDWQNEKFKTRAKVLTGVHGADNPARNQPLQRDSYLKRAVNIMRF